VVLVCSSVDNGSVTQLALILPGHFFDDPKRPLSILLIGFIFTFAVARVNTRITRAHGRSRLGIGSVVTPGGLHIHHSVFGIVAMVVAGILAFALRPGSPWVEMLAFAFGSGAALTLDEFALILHLEDVYWTGEGRSSIDAVILGITFITLLLTGLLPRSLHEVGGHIELSHWAVFVLIVAGAAFVVVCYLKGKLFMGTIGIFVLPVAVIGAMRLAKPNSPWARSQYAHSPVKLERARRRDQGLNERWRRRKHAIWDVIGGKPHLHLPYRHVHEEHEAATADDGSRKSSA
jgi:hypothetical protein